MKIRTLSTLIRKLVLYNIRIVFAHKFIYFLIASVLFFLVVTITNLFSNGGMSPDDVFYFLIFPGLLFIFYPTTYGIQNDKDAAALELIFGIPNYRYKVWLVRLVLTFSFVAFLLLLVALLTNFVIVKIPIAQMVYQLLYPIFFLGALAFMMSTVVKNGQGTAVVMVVLGIGMWILQGQLDASKWNVFLNPFDMPSDLSELAWNNLIFANRLYIASGTAIAMLWGLLNLQKREKLVR